MSIHGNIEMVTLLLDQFRGELLPTGSQLLFALGSGGVDLRHSLHEKAKTDALDEAVPAPGARRHADFDDQYRITADDAYARIERDARGNPTGLFVDAATSLLDTKVPPPTATMRSGLSWRASERSISLIRRQVGSIPSCWNIDLRSSCDGPALAAEGLQTRSARIHRVTFIIRWIVTPAAVRGRLRPNPQEL